MTRFERDMFKVLCGAGDVVIARREAGLAVFKEEHKKCLNPFRKELLREEIARESRKLLELRNQHMKLLGPVLPPPPSTSPIISKSQ